MKVRIEIRNDNGDLITAHAEQLAKGEIKLFVDGKQPVTYEIDERLDMPVIQTSEFYKTTWGKAD